MEKLKKILTEDKIVKIIARWDRFGLLEFVKNKQNVALAMDFTSVYLVDKAYGGTIETQAFIAIERLFRNLEEDLTIEFIADNVLEILVKLRTELEKLGDIEWELSESAEFISKFVEEYPPLKNKEDICVK